MPLMHKSTCLACCNRPWKSAKDFLRRARDDLGLSMGVRQDQRASLPAPKYELFAAAEIGQATYERDLAECRDFARRADPAADAAKGGVVGGAIGAAVGAVVGALTGNVGRAAAIGAAGGATGGVLRGGLRGGARQKRIIRRCLRGRGYRVLD